MQDQLVSIIVRTCSRKRLNLLDQALFSIFCSDYESIEVVVVVQTESDDYYYEVKSIAYIYSQLGLSVKLLRNKTYKDERSKNLNIGISEAKGRYIGFLDDDDVLYPEHISLLVSIIKQSETTAWAYSDVAIINCDVDPCGNLYMLSRDYRYQKNGFSYLNLWIDNYIPIHSYIIDCQRLDSYLLKFDESLTALEDYAFILKIASIYEPKYVNKVTCEYRFRLDGSNTTAFGADSSSKTRMWEEARNRLEKVREEILLNDSFNRDGKCSQAAYNLVKSFQSKSQQIQAELQHLQSQSQYTQAELERAHSQLQQSHTELERAHSQLQQSHTELERAQQRIKAMESSKFWKLRSQWFRVKKVLGLKGQE